MPGEKHGEYISICWESGFVDAAIVKGHVTEDDFWTAVDARNGRETSIGYYSRYGVHTIPRELFGPLKHTYARWMPDHSGEYGCLFVEQKAQRRGAFKITMAELFTDRGWADRYFAWVDKIKATADLSGEP